MHEPFTSEWAGALRETINASAAYRTAGRRWVWPTALVVRADPGRGLPESRAVVLDLHAGECRGARVVAAGEASAEFVLSGDFEAWKAIISGELDPLTALLRSRLRLERGSLTRLALHAAAARALARCAAAVPTRFPDGSTAAGRPESPFPEARRGASPPTSPDAARVRRHDDAGADGDHDPYLRLFRNAARLSWDPESIDLSRDREDWSMIRRDYATEQYAEQIHRLCSLFHEGEKSVTRTLSPFLGAVSRAGLGIGPELHLAAQVYEEARHFAFFERYFREVLEDGDVARHMSPAAQAVLESDLEDVAERIRREDDRTRLRALLVEGVIHYMGVVEAMLARTGYRGAGMALGERGWLPGLQEGFRLIRRDEGRHVAFGIQFIADSVRRDPRAADLVERTFERHLPNVLATVSGFDFTHPLVDVAVLQDFALGAYRQFMAAAGLAEAPAGELEAELAEGRRGTS